METTPIAVRKLGVAVAIVTLVLGVAGVVAAQTGPSSDCTGDTVATFGEMFYGLEDEGNRLLSTAPQSREYAISLGAGTYTLNGVSYDGYDKREEIGPQTQEQWFAEFIGSDGSVLATSGITGDLEDLVNEATWSGAMGEVTLGAAATAIRITHAAPGSDSVNSVRPVCVGATNNAEPSPEPAPTTTEAPAPASSLSVDFVSTSSTSSSVSAACAELTESALGVEVSLEIADIPASSSCAVEYPTTLDCTTSIEPLSVTGASATGVQNIIIPVAGGVDASMIIDCVEPQVASVVETTTTSAPPAAVTATTVAPTTPKAAVEVETEVQQVVETAPAATAQTGQPAFTG